MARLWVVMEEIETGADRGDHEQYVLGIHLSRNSALEFVKEHGINGKHLYIVDAPVIDKDGDTNENTFLRLQRSLSRVERRLGKTREALRLANKRLDIYRKWMEADDAIVQASSPRSNDNIVMADPVYRVSWAEPGHEDD